MATRESGFESTCWTQIRRAAGGDAREREAFAQRYIPVVEAYLRARWKRSPLVAEIPDAVQEVFLECLKERGAIERAEPRRAGGFRAYLHGITRNVAARIEQKRRPAVAPTTSELAEKSGPAGEDPARAFLREWARAIMDQAADALRERATYLGAAAATRIEILRLRFEEGLPVRAIAERLELPAERAHKQYSLARKEFRDVLRDIVAFHLPNAPEAVDAECRKLLELL